MIAVHKISEDFYETPFVLIAIHSSVEDYAMAYTINDRVQSNLKRFDKDLDIAETVSFPIFEWKDTVNDAYWTLIANHSNTAYSLQNNGFFKDEPSYAKHYVLPEHKDVDYFLKIEQDDNTIETIESVLQSIQSSPHIVTAYTINTSNLKSKNNLIF